MRHFAGNLRGILNPREFKRRPRSFRLLSIPRWSQWIVAATVSEEDSRHEGWFLSVTLS
jgi:hypothetical protein